MATEYLQKLPSSIFIQYPASPALPKFGQPVMMEAMLNQWLKTLPYSHRLYC
jgi:hypothetical protein